ncbi:B3 domain-containing protein [Sesamum angolense]|uniref:B3 domain-containing protein n=1 Tax=Sesamum angolense TaxID=2727404 RepID=A0AAE1W5A3_9LAMI|nr:B3 domain-containing protein [Sesamum angolense]
MASSSRLSCFHCQDASSNPDHFRNGWRLRGGEYAQLCPRCAFLCMRKADSVKPSIQNDDGWRDCESCGKLVHCGCIVSFNTHLLLDFGGLICMECSRALSLVLNDDVKPYQSNESSSNNMNVRLNQARNRCLSLEPEIRAKEPYQERTGQALLEAHPKATVTPLFEKILSASDADLKLARLIIPKDVRRHFSLIFLPCMVCASRYRIQKAMNGNSTTDIGSMVEVGFMFLRGSEIIWSQKNGSRVIQLNKCSSGHNFASCFRKYLSYVLSSGSRGKGGNGFKKTSADHQLTWHSIHFFPPESKDNVYSRKRTTAAGTLSKTPFLFNVLRKALVSKRKSHTLLLIAKNQMIERRKPVCQLQRDTAVTRSIRPHCICAATRLRKIRNLDNILKNDTRTSAKNNSENL